MKQSKEFIFQQILHPFPVTIRNSGLRVKDMVQSVAP